MCFKLLFIFLFATPAFSQSGLRLLFPAARQYIYSFSTNVSISTEPRGVRSSRWLLDGTLAIQPYDNYTRARLFLDVRKKTVYGNNGPYDLFAVEDDNYIKNPWELEYQEDGFIKSVFVLEEPTWSVNLKRAISVNLQLTRHSQGQPTYYTNEPCLDDVCVMVYTVRGNLVRKYTSLRYPTARTAYSWGSVPWREPSHDTPHVESISSAERAYEMDDQKGLIELDLRGSYQYKTHHHILAVTSDLSLKLKEDRPSTTVDKLPTRATGLQYEAGDFSDPHNGIAEHDQEYLARSSYELLLKIARKGIDADNIVRNASLIHNIDFIDLLNTMSQLKYMHLIKLFNDLVLGTSYDLETARNIFLEILPHVRSDACARFIKYLVVEEKEKVEDAALLSLIRKLPFNIAVHSQQLLEDLEAFTRLSLDFSPELRSAGILSFATLTHKAMEVGQLKQDYFDNIVVKYFRMYSECPLYRDRLSWLQGLANIGFTAEHYTRVVATDAGRGRHERLWAILGGAQYTDNQYSRVVLQTALPILTNDSEPILLRIASLHQLLSSPHVSHTDLQFVHDYITSSSDQHLKSFWYYTVRNLAANKDFTGYRVASYYIPFIANQVPSPDPLYWATNNYIISALEEDGAPSLQALSVGDPRGALPTFVGVKLFTGGRRPYKADVYITAEGLLPAALSHLQLDRRHMSAPALLRLLKTFATWKPRSDAEEPHIDIVVKLHEKTVYAAHLNHTRFLQGKDMKYLEDILLFGSHINQQIVYYPFQTDVHIPTEIGTPIRLQSTILSFTSIRGNLTAPTNEDDTWRNDLHIRYQGTSVTSLSTAAPLAETVHIARIQQSLVAHLPLTFNVSLTIADNTVRVVWPAAGSQQAGAAMHARAHLTTHSPTHTPHHAPIGHIQNRKDSIFFDCERPMTGTELVNQLFASNTKHHEFLHPIQPSLVLLNGVVLFSAPPAGSCGVILQPRLAPPDSPSGTPPGQDLLELTLQLQRGVFDVRKLELEARLNFKYYNVESPGRPYIDIAAVTALRRANDATDLSINIEGHQPDATGPLNHWDVSIQNKETTFPSFLTDISPHPALYEGTLSVDVCDYIHNDTSLVVEYRGGGRREVMAKVVGRNVSRLGIFELGAVRHSSWGQLLHTYKSDLLNVTALLKEHNGVASLTINNGTEMRFKLDHFDWMLDRWTDMQMAKNLGLYRECRVGPWWVRTLSGASGALPPPQAEMDLLLADCTPEPTFAVFRTAGGVVVHNGDHRVNVTTTNGHVTISDYDRDHFTVETKHNVTKVSLTPGTVVVYHRTSDTAVLAATTNADALCGLCVSHGDMGTSLEDGEIETDEYRGQ